MTGIRQKHQDADPCMNECWWPLMRTEREGERKDKLSLACACDVMHSLETLPARRPSQLKHHNCELNKLLFFIDIPPQP